MSAASSGAASSPEPLWRRRLESWLEANNATAEDVIAIGVTADGSLAVFTN